MIPFILFFGGLAAWFLSTVAAGGGALLMLPVVGFLIGAQAVAPVVTIGTLIAAPSRAVLFWKHIDWSIVRWQIPGSSVGALVGGYLFTIADPTWLQFFLGIFLIFTSMQFILSRKDATFTMLNWVFLPVSFIVALISGLIGGVGPVLNPFYLNSGLRKEALVATKAFNSLFMQTAKIATYFSLGALAFEYVIYGIMIGVGSVIGSYFGKKALGKMPVESFKLLVIAVMFIVGSFMITQSLTR